MGSRSEVGKRVGNRDGVDRHSGKSGKNMIRPSLSLAKWYIAISGAHQLPTVVAYSILPTTVGELK